MASPVHRFFDAVWSTNDKGQRLLPQCHSYPNYYADLAFFTAAHRFR